MNNEISEALVSKLKWSTVSAELGLSANFRCEYCGLDFLSSVENYKQWQIDHILPASIYPEKINDPENKALACRTCNFDLKKNWDVSKVVSSNASRIDKIKAIQKYLFIKRSEALIEITNVRKIISQDN